jgi:hypothetical protein
MIINNENIILIIQYYIVNNNDKDYQEKRQNEINKCLIINNDNKFINEIHLLVEEIYDLSFLNNTSKIKQILIKKRLTYQDVFEYYNNNLSNQICILSNADIYFDESLNMLKYVNFNFKTILCMTRYEDNEDNQLKLLSGLEYDISKNLTIPDLKRYRPSIWSQDCWIWKDHNIKIKNSNFNLGIVGCDNHIAYLFYLNNYSIINPSKLISINHLDRIRNRITEYGILKGDYSKSSRIKTINEYVYFRNNNDIPDFFTNSLYNKIDIIDRSKILIKIDTKKSCIKLDNFILETSSYKNNNISDYIYFKNKDNYWIPRDSDTTPYIIISFPNIEKINIIDIRGKTVDRNDRIIGGVESFNIKYINQNENIIELDKKFNCINHHNGNFINRFYLDELECKYLIIYNIKFIGIRTIKIRLWKTTNYKVQEMKIISAYNNNYKLEYFNDYLSWQKPVITEYQIFKNLVNNKIIPYNYFAFPWANYIDNKHLKKKYEYLIDILSKHKNTDENINYFTIIQHIRFRDYLYILKKLNIKYIFTPHKLISDLILEEKYDIKIIPISLFPVQHKNNIENINNIYNRLFLISFIGFYNPKIYISGIRKKIFELFSKYYDCFIKETKEWHYQSFIYKNKIDNNLEKNEQEYKLSLAKSIFSLCPSGSGPNSIRIWESISYGTIPVILADNLVLPKIEGLNYEECFIFWKESEIENLYEYLKNIDIQKIESMSKKCIEVYNNYFAPDKMHLQILEYFSN